MRITELLQKPCYNFLRTNPDLRNVIYLTLSGSHGYGTNNENSDVDLRGCLLEEPQYIFGLQGFAQFEDLQTDTVIYGAKKFVKLCAEANPNALELLGTEEDCIAIMTEEGKRLRDNAHVFLSKRVAGSFGNYATAQLRRLQNALCHDDISEQNKLVHLRNTLNAQLEHFRRTYTAFGDNAIQINSDGEVLRFDMHLTDYPVNDFVGIYTELSNTVKTYNKLNHRNQKKDDAHLYKHAMHLIRLLITGTDILEGKGIVTKRRAEHTLLMDIRNGKYSFPEIFKLTDAYQARFEKAAAETCLPAVPDMARIEALLVSLYAHK